ncbi:MAG: DNA mismatch repair protein MutS [Prevotellaceae bacterium]|jgi:dsDNA-specific endonuclease/ATPase MutS2|nr:DNA mismatch repair protein MutS [Prevotellaceae bacterium]
MNENDEILTLKKSLFNTLGGSYLLDKLNLKSSLSRRYLYAQKFITDKQELENEFDKIETTISFLNDKNNSRIFADVEHKLSQILDIGGSLQNIENAIILTEVELFEIKKFSIITDDIRQAINSFNLIDFPDLSDIINILDPEKTRIATFYIYDAYSAEIAALRRQIKQKQSDSTAELYQKIVEIEDEIRRQLSKKLQSHAQNLKISLSKIAYLDILLAKAKQATDEHFCKPAIVADTTAYKALFNPQMKDLLNTQNRKYQPVDINFGQYPTLITGINMGGKTVFLKTVALAQYLCQYGFYVPAVDAEIALVDKIMICIDDEQNHLQGLSSFAAEMKSVNEILSEIAANKRLLVLIDELARTTNPAEGSAIVSAMLDMLSERNVCSFITTHYDKIASDCRRLRVRGLIENTEIKDEKNIEQYIDYSLIRETETNIPHEALRIAEMLGVNSELIRKAKEKI